MPMTSPAIPSRAWSAMAGPEEAVPFFQYRCCGDMRLRAAFERASKQHLAPEELKAIAVHRLASEIANPTRTDGVKPIEVLGKMKDFDWFVRNSETSMGVFLALTEEPPPTDALQAIDRYRD